MVATVLRIRLRILGNMLTRSAWQLVGFIAGALAAGGAVVVVAISLALIGGFGLEPTRVVITIGGALLVIGWGVAPLLAGGVDTTVDAERLAPFPMSTRQVMLALAAIGLIGLPGVASALGALSALTAWVRWPTAFAAALVCLPLGVLTCILVSRTVASFSSRGGRGIGNVFGLLALTALVLAGPIITGLAGLAGGSGDEFVARVLATVSGISWTPIGAAWAVPGDVAAGEFGAAGLKLLIALGTLAALWLLWRRNVRAAVLTPHRRAVVRGGRLGVYGVLPTGGTGASWARALHYWLTDPRYVRNLVIVALLPILLAFAMGGRLDGALFAFVGVLPALLLGLVPYADVAFDGTAFATVLATGIRGRADRTGRLLAATTVGLPLVLGVAVVTVALSGRWMLLPGILGCSVGALLVGLGVCAVSSAYIVIPVPASGDNIFKRVPGATFTTGLALFGLTLLAGFLTLPSLVLVLLAAFGFGAPASWAAFVVGPLVGVAVAWGGVVWGGRAFDTTGPLLLTRIRATVGY